MTPTALLIMDVQQGIVARFAGDGDPGIRIPGAVAPAPGEVVVTKRRVSA